MSDVEFYQQLYNSKNPVRRWLHTSRRQYVQETIFDYANVNPQFSALEVGFGDGTYLRYLSKFTSQVTGFDFDATLIGAVQGRNETQAKFILGDIRSWNFAESYDFILCTEMLEHILETEEVLKNLASALKPQGGMLLTTPNKFSILEICARLLSLSAVRKILSYIYGEKVQDLGHIGLRTESELRQIFSRVGLKVVKVHNMGLYIPLLVELLPFMGTVKILAFLERLLQKSPLKKLLWTQAYHLKKINAT